MKIFLVSILFFAAVFQALKTPGDIGTPPIKEDYFWNNTRDLKLLRSKSNVLTETIKNGYYGDKEYLTFVDKKLSSIKFTKNGVIDSVATFKNGNGYLRTKNDTIFVQNGKLNGKSFFYSYYVIHFPTVKNPKAVFAKDQDRYVLDFKDNFLKSMLVYRKGILIYESYFKKYDFIKENLDKMKDDSNFLDSIKKVYNEDGTLRATSKYKNGHVQ